jgi:hypothetical protein
MTNLRHPHNGVLLPPELDEATDAEKDEYAERVKGTMRLFNEAYFAAGLDQITEHEEPRT